MLVFCPNGHENPDSNRFCQACGTQIVIPVHSQVTVGVTLGDRYRITKEIGQGGFGRTYLCEDVNRFNELCVLKEFAPQVQGTALLTKAQQLFEREAGVMYRLQHPQIPMFREMFRVNRGGAGQLFLVQDYVAGDNYQQLLRQKLQQGKKFTEDEITEFLTQILPVLGYIHSLGVIHRDISPDNLIKRSSDGLPVLIDFGGVKQVAVNAATQYMSGNLGHSEVPTRLGKVGYAPNEQMQRGVVFPHSDLYALAATTLVLLTGKEPPDLIDPQNFTWNWREYISLSPTLASVLDRMLQLRPNDRFESAQDILTALNSGNLGNPAPPPRSPLPPTVQTQPKIEAKSQAATVVATPQSPPQVPPTQTTSKPTSESSLVAVLGKTWLAIGAVIGAIGLGWAVASLTGKRPQPVSSPVSINSPEPTPSQSERPTAVASERNSTSPTPQPTISGIATISEIKPLVPASLTGKGVNDRVFGEAVKQVFISQNPQTKVMKIGDAKIQSQVDAISNDLGGKLDRNLSRDAVRRIGQYSAGDRSSWRSQVNKLHLGERALIDLTDAKYRAITEFSAQKLGVGFDRFLNTPIGQVYLATMFDRVEAIKSKQAIGEIIFPIGGDNGTVSGTLQPGEGKAYIASLAKGQDITVDLKANEPTNLSVYPPTQKLPAMLSASQTTNWTGKTQVNGYHEFVLVSHSDRPIQYELKLTASDLEPSSTSGNKTKSPSNNPDKAPLW
jgi:serine/threonine protein kinase, bacterial